jgi:hypothetical protein
MLVPCRNEQEKYRKRNQVPLQQGEQEEPQFPITLYYVFIIWLEKVVKIFVGLRKERKSGQNIAEVEESRHKNDSTRRMGGWELGGSSAGSGDQFWSGLAWLNNWDRCDGREGLDAVKGKKKVELEREAVAEEGKDRDTDRY